ncbi:MAG: nuclear transport factor 2 family protein [Actinomycetota bacterium]|nr:nuclear transport factor 2 family protein [Actinomycetota bacterium]
MTSPSHPTIDGPEGPVAQVLALLAEHAAAHEARDAAALLALYAPDAVSYTLAPPLQQGPETAYGTAEGVQRWFETFDGPVGISYRDPVVTVAGDLALVHCLTRMTARPQGSGSPFSFWMRSTFGVRHVGARWVIVHRHESTPFHMDGSFRAAVDLLP